MQVILKYLSLKFMIHKYHNLEITRSSNEELSVKTLFLSVYLLDTFYLGIFYILRGSLKICIFI